MKLIQEDLVANFRQAYLIGIGGVGMSALARVLKHRGLAVAGSDLIENKMIRALAAAGIPAQIGLEADSFAGADLVIYSSAIPENHKQLLHARSLGLCVHHRAEILASLLNCSKTSVGITGTHGKTTTSSMVSFVLSELGYHPTGVIGGDLVNFETNAVLGNSDLIVAEIDESDRSHELYAPNYLILTNLEQEHVDCYRTVEDLKASFARFLENVRNPGLIAYYAEDPAVTEVVLASGKPCVSYGFSPEFAYSARNVDPADYGSEFEFYEHGFYARTVKLSVPGIHNVANALGALAVLIHLGVDLDDAAETISRFRGARRRLEVKHRRPDFFVVDDYAHHPTEIRASLEALRQTAEYVTAIFQPHRFSRTGFFYRDFAVALRQADEIILTDIYAAGESNPGEVSSQMIYDELVKLGQPCVHLIPCEKIIPFLEAKSRLRGAVAFLGAGNIGEVANEFADRCKTAVEF